MKRKVLVLALSVLAVTACGKKEAPVAEAPAPAPVRSEAPKAEAAAPAAAPAEAAQAAAPVAANDEEKVLNIYNWADYIPADMVAAQIDAVASDIGVDAAKTGMLGTAAIVEAVAAARASTNPTEPGVVASSLRSLDQPLKIGRDVHRLERTEVRTACVANRQSP